MTLSGPPRSPALPPRPAWLRRLPHGTRLSTSHGLAPWSRRALSLAAGMELDARGREEAAGPATPLCPREGGSTPGREEAGMKTPTRPTCHGPGRVTDVGTAQLAGPQPVLGLGTWACRLGRPVAAPPIPTVHAVDTCTPAPPPRAAWLELSRKPPGGLCPAPALSPGGAGRPLRPTASLPCDSRPCPLVLACSATLGSALARAGRGAGGTCAVQGAGCAAQASPGVTGVAPVPPEASFFHGRRTRMRGEIARAAAAARRPKEPVTSESRWQPDRGRVI